MLGLGALRPDSSPAKTETFRAAMDLALADAKTAFRAFLADRPDKKRPFIIAAHSQGCFHMVKARLSSLAHRGRFGCYRLICSHGNGRPTEVRRFERPRAVSVHVDGLLRSTSLCVQ